MCAASSETYSAAPTTSDGVEIVRLNGPGDVVVSVAPKIGNNAYEFIVNGKNALWFPFDSVAEFAAAPELCGNPLLAPWANRLDEHAFFADGVRYELNRGIGNYLTDPAGQPIHGLLLYSSAWEVVEVGSDSDSAWVRSRLEFGRFPALMAQFPFAHSISVTYLLAGTSLEVRTAVENHGAEPMPVSVGFHPYFQLHDSRRDEWRVHLAADSLWELNERFTPTGATSPVTDTFPGAADLPLRGEFLDHVFGDLKADSDGWARFSVGGAGRAPDGGVRGRIPSCRGLRTAWRGTAIPLFRADVRHHKRLQPGPPRAVPAASSGAARRHLDGNVPDLGAGVLIQPGCAEPTRRS